MPEKETAGRPGGKPAPFSLNFFIENILGLAVWLSFAFLLNLRHEEAFMVQAGFIIWLQDLVMNNPGPFVWIIISGILIKLFMLKTHMPKFLVLIISLGLATVFLRIFMPGLYQNFISFLTHGRY